MTDDTINDLDAGRLDRYFNRLAPHYLSHDWLQQEVGERALERLDGIRLAPRLIVDAGAGAGRHARSLAKRYRAATIIQFDRAEAMLAASREHGPRWRSPHRYACGDISQIPLANDTVDLVLCTCVLQWCGQLEQPLGELRRILKPGGLLLLAFPGPDTLSELRAALAAVSGGAHVNRFPDMHDVGDLLGRQGFADPVMECERLTIEYKDVEGLLTDLRLGGSINAIRSRPRGLLGRRRHATFAAAYEAQRRNEKLPVTAELIIGHAWAAAGARNVTGESQIFPLKRLRRR